MSKNKYVDLKVNGRLFPSWVLKNFKEFKLQTVFRNDIDPCSITTHNGKKEYKKYQLFLSKFLDYNGPYHNILIYHGVGTGKTATAINIYNMLYNYDIGWNVFILIKATLKNDPWLKDLEVYLTTDKKNVMMKNIKFISYDAPNADKLFMEAIKSGDINKKSIYIIDEVHNFIRNVYSNITTRQGTRAQIIYNYIIKDKLDNESTRVILMSATPVINTPFELALLFNLLRPNIFPKSELQFNSEYIAEKSINPIRKNMFQRRIMGLVSYYSGMEPNAYASKIINYVDVEMSGYQEDIYIYFENIEDKIALKMHSIKGSFSKKGLYRSYTRQSCNFVFPNMGNGMTGEMRPRPRNFKISEKDDQKIMNLTKTSYYKIQNYIDAINKYIEVYKNYLESMKKSSNRTLEDDVNDYHEKYKDNYNEFNNDVIKSDLYKTMYESSAKFIRIIFTILASKGTILLYSNYVLMEGLEIFSIYLDYFGFSRYGTETKSKFKYAEYHGGIDKKQRSNILQIFNKKENINGDIIKILMISSAGSEGLNLMNVRQVHIMESYWNEPMIQQVIGRAIRLCSHKQLPLNERHVDVYRYRSIKKNITLKPTADQFLGELAKSKEELNNSFLMAMKEVAIDCELNKSQNSLLENIRCFRFEDATLFDKQILPAYKDDPIDDFKLSSGSNTLFTKIISVKLVKIKALINSKIGSYYLDKLSGYVYDPDTYFCVGTIAYEDNIPKKHDADTYIIDKIIPIPI